MATERNREQRGLANLFCWRDIAKEEKEKMLYMLILPGCETSKAHSELIEDVYHRFRTIFTHDQASQLLIPHSGLILSLPPSCFWTHSVTCFLKLFSLLVAAAVYVAAAARPPGCGEGDAFNSIDGSSCDTPKHTSIKATKEGVVSDLWSSSNSSLSLFSVAIILRKRFISMGMFVHRGDRGDRGVSGL